MRLGCRNVSICFIVLSYMSLCLNTDKDDFIVNSGWFTFPGMSKGDTALQHVLARKANLNYDKFMAVRKAIYKLNYREEKVNAYSYPTLCFLFISIR